MGRDFIERHEDEGALGEARVRDLKAGVCEDHVAVENKVEIEGAGAVGRAGGAIAAEFEFDGEKRVEQIAWGKMGFKSDNGVYEAGLVGESDGRGGVERGTHGDVAERGEALGGGGESGFGRARWTEDVAAEGDGCGRHAE